MHLFFFFPSFSLHLHLICLHVCKTLCSNWMAWAANSIRTAQSCWFSMSQHICSPFWMQSELKTKATIESTEVVPWHMCRWRHTEVKSFLRSQRRQNAKHLIQSTSITKILSLKFQTFLAAAEAAKFCPTSNASARLEKSGLRTIHIHTVIEITESWKMLAYVGSEQETDLFLFISAVHFSSEDWGYHHATDEVSLPLSLPCQYSTRDILLHNTATWAASKIKPKVEVWKWRKRLGSLRGLASCMQMWLWRGLWWVQASDFVCFLSQQNVETHSIKSFLQFDASAASSSLSQLAVVPSILMHELVEFHSCTKKQKVFVVAVQANWLHFAVRMHSIQYISKRKHFLYWATHPSNVIRGLLRDDLESLSWCTIERCTFKFPSQNMYNIYICI